MGLVAERVEWARAQLAGYQEGTGLEHPLFPGHVAMMGHDGAVVASDASGYAVLYRDATELLPPGERVPVREDTVFDLASVSKLFTSICVVQLVERGQVDLQQPVARYLPEFGNHGKEAITVQQLLAHTSGLDAWMPLWSAYPDRASREHRRSAYGPSRVGLPGPGVAGPGGDGGHPRVGTADRVPVLRPEPDHARGDGGEADRKAARPGGPGAGHRSAGDARHRLQPGRQAAHRSHRVPDRPGPRNGPRRGARRERLVARRGRRPCRGLLHRLGPGGAVAGAAQRRPVRRAADPVAAVGDPADHERQPAVPRRRPRAGLRAEPALVRRGPGSSTPATPGRRW